MPSPFVPQFDINGEDSKSDIEKLVSYIYDLDSFLNEGDPDGTWSTVDVVPNRTLTIGGTLEETQHALGTLIQTLQSKGIL